MFKPQECDLCQGTYFRCEFQSSDANKPSKCVLWGGPLNKDNAVNTGQTRNKFEVAIAGSNAYQNPNLKNPDGFTLTGVPGNAAINAPYDRQGYNTAS